MFDLGGLPGLLRGQDSPKLMVFSQVADDLHNHFAVHLSAQFSPRCPFVLLGYPVRDSKSSGWTLAAAWRACFIGPRMDSWARSEVLSLNMW